MSTADGHVSESLSDIDDSEVAGYLNSKEAARFKRIIWEVLNKDYDQGKSRKRARKAKKAAPLEKAAKVSTGMNNKERLSSKIDFDALKKLNEDLGPGFEGGTESNCPGFEGGTESNCGSRGDERLSNQRRNSFEGSHDEELERENTYSEEVEAGKSYEDDTYVANDEYSRYNYDEECNYNEGYNNDDGYDFDEL
ncbi:hypothetical protein TB2_004398 [Malus domestica]|uniref:uncharacterized protein n=1 Tax=Malus domestica TaxID=3750 RepID=UPI000498B54F|nr:uncharacterized protein LOC103446071 isoform X1 [Malus domestica]